MEIDFYWVEDEVETKPKHTTSDVHLPSPSSSSSSSSFSYSSSSRLGQRRYSESSPSRTPSQTPSRTPSRTNPTTPPSQRKPSTTLPTSNDDTFNGIHVGRGALFQPNSNSTKIKPQRRSSIASFLFGEKEKPSINPRSASDGHLSVSKSIPTRTDSHGTEHTPHQSAPVDWQPMVTPPRILHTVESQTHAMKALASTLRTVSLRRPSSGMVLKGLGLQLGYNTSIQVCFISDVTPNSVAAATELLYVNDVIVDIDGTFVLDLSLDKIIMTLATAGREVNLVVTTLDAARSTMNAMIERIPSTLSTPNSSSPVRSSIYSGQFWQDSPPRRPDFGDGNGARGSGGVGGVGGGVSGISISRQRMLSTSSIDEPNSSFRSRANSTTSMVVETTSDPTLDINTNTTTNTNINNGYATSAVICSPIAEQLKTPTHDHTESNSNSNRHHTNSYYSHTPSDTNTTPIGDDGGDNNHVQHHDHNHNNNNNNSSNDHNNTTDYSRGHDRAANHHSHNTTLTGEEDDHDDNHNHENDNPDHNYQNNNHNRNANNDNHDHHNDSIDVDHDIDKTATTATATATTTTPSITTAALSPPSLHNISNRTSPNVTPPSSSSVSSFSSGMNLPSTTSGLNLPSRQSTATNDTNDDTNNDNVDNTDNTATNGDNNDINNNNNNNNNTNNTDMGAVAIAVTDTDTPMNSEGASVTTAGGKEYGFFVKAPPKRMGSSSGADTPSSSSTSTTTKDMLQSSSSSSSSSFSRPKSQSFISRMFSTPVQPQTLQAIEAAKKVIANADNADDDFIDTRSIPRDLCSMRSASGSVHSAFGINIKSSRPAGLRTTQDISISNEDDVPRLSLAEEVTLAMNDGSSKVKSFLQSIGLEKLEDVFITEEIDFETIPTLTEADLEKIGIAKLGVRKKIMRGIKQLSTGHMMSPTSSEHSYQTDSMSIVLKTPRSGGARSIRSSVSMSASEQSAFSNVRGGSSVMSHGMDEDGGSGGHGR